MPRHLIPPCLLLLLCLLPAGFGRARTGAPEGETRFCRGRVVDSQTGEPLVGVILTLFDGEGRALGYASTTPEGRFAFEAGADAVRIGVHLLGYRNAELPLPLAEGSVVGLEPEPIHIREVSIRAPRLTLGEDTVRYRVDGYAEAADRTIADVLEKMPGIEVKPGGEVHYMGEAITHLYIDGLDLLEGRYGVATRNLRPEDVQSVEVLENHQPIRALRNLRFSDRAAINLKLKPDVRNRWSGTLTARGGFRPLLWSGGLFALRVGAGNQSLLQLKSDNTGLNPAEERQQLTPIDPSESAELLPKSEGFGVGISAAPLDERRTRRNLTHSASFYELKKLSEAYRLRASATYAYDRLTSEHSTDREWYLPEGSRSEEEHAKARSTVHEAEGRVGLQANTDRFYLDEELRATLAWRDAQAVLTGTYPARERASTPVFEVSNRLKYIRRTGNRALELVSRAAYRREPQWLRIGREADRVEQRFDANTFAADHHVRLRFGRGRLSAGVDAGLELYTRSLESTLTGSGLPLDTVNDCSVVRLKASLRPDVTWHTPHLRIMVEGPVGWSLWRIGTTAAPHRTTDRLLWNPRASLRWLWSGRFAFTATGSVGVDEMPAEEIAPAAILEDFRNVRTGRAMPYPSRKRSASAAIEYKNPMGGLLVRLTSGLTAERHPLLVTRRFQGDYIVQGLDEGRAPARSLFAAADVSQHIEAIHGRFHGTFQWVSAHRSMVLDGVTTPYTSRNWSIAPTINLRLWRWLTADYRVEWRVATLRPAGQSATVQRAFGQQLTLYFAPHRNAVLTLRAAHDADRLRAGQTVHTLLCDVQAGWKFHPRWELTASVTNLFDRRTYAYRLLDALSAAGYRYAIRPRNVLFGVTWSFR